MLIALGGLDGAQASTSPESSAGHRAIDGTWPRVARVDTNPAAQSEINLPCGSILHPVLAAQPNDSGAGKPALMKPAAANPEFVNPAAAQSALGNLLDQSICDGAYCVSLPAVAASIHKQLDCNVVGYAFFVGNALTGPKGLFGAYGLARTTANKPAEKFTADTKMQIASTSKVLTALATLKVMGSNINKPAYTYFPPGWTLQQNSIVKQITVRQFVSQTSGVQQYYAAQTGQTYANLQAFFTQNLANPNAPRTCPGPGVTVANPIITDITPCYTDTNFGLMRIVLPRAGGSNSSDPQTLADTYVSQVQANVFTPVGVSNVACKQPASGYAFAYNFPGTTPGTNFGGDLTLQCGDWGWWVSVRDYAKVLVSLNAQDGKILGNCGLYDMVTNPASHPVGWDIISDGTHRWLEKNGADGWVTNAGSGAMSTSVGIYGGKDGCVVKGKGTSPIPGVAAVLFMNSPIKGSNNIADTVLLTALQAATTPDH